MPKLRHFGAQSYPTTTSFRDKERKVFASAAKFAKPSTVSLEKTSSAFLQLQNLSSALQNIALKINWTTFKSLLAFPFRAEPQ